jgi:hypothetical protein
MLNTQANRERLAQARQGAEGLTDQLGAASQGAQEYAAGLQNQTNELRERIRSLLGNTAMARRTDVQNEIAALENQVNENNQIITGLQDAFTQSQGTDVLSLNPQQMELLGLQEGQGLYGANFQNYNAMLPDQVAFDPNQALSQDQYAQLSALAGLAGTYGGEFTNPFAGSGELTGGVDYTQPTDFSGVQSGIAAAKANYEKKYNEPFSGWKSPLFTSNRVNQVPATPKQVEQHIEDMYYNLIGSKPNLSKANKDMLYSKYIAPLKAELDTWRANQGGNQRVQAMTNFAPPQGIIL